MLKLKYKCSLVIHLHCPIAGATNPFAMTNPGAPVQEVTPNPFASREQQQPRVPMNQMSSSSSMGFSTTQPPNHLGPSPGPTMPFGGGSPAFGQPMGQPPMMAPPGGGYNMSPAFGQPVAPPPVIQPVGGYGQMAAQPAGMGPPPSSNPFL